MDATRLRQIFEHLDGDLEHPTELLIRGGAALLAHGLEQRVTVDIDVLPVSRFVEADLRQAHAAAGIGFNPLDKDFVELGCGYHTLYQLTFETEKGTDHAGGRPQRVALFRPAAGAGRDHHLRRARPVAGHS